MKYCPACEKNKNASEFGNNAARPDGKQAYCKACSRARGKRRRDLPDYPEAQRTAFLKWKYGVTPEQYDQLLQIQEGCCAVCKVDAEGARRPGQAKQGVTYGLVVDHDHTTGVIRGLLCNRCNMALGLFEDRSSLLTKGAAYLATNGLNLDPAHRPTRRKPPSASTD